MYDDYDDDIYMDEYDDKIDSYNDEIDGYNDDLRELDDDEFFLNDSYESEIREIDEYWDRENEYIKSSGIYTDEEVQQILENHEEIRNSKKEEARANFERDKELLLDEREQLHSDIETAKSNRDTVKLERDMAQEERATSRVESYAAYSNPVPHKPSVVKRAFTAAAIYHFIKKLFK